MPTCIIIVGGACVGKTTVAQKLSKLTRFALLHNHICIEPVMESYGVFDINLIVEMRRVMFDYAVRNRLSCIITNVINFDSARDVEYLHTILDTFRETHDIHIVELVTSLQTRLERANTANRLATKKSQRDVKAVRQRIALSGDARYVSIYELDGYKHSVIDNTNLSATVTAKQIMQLCGLE